MMFLKVSLLALSLITVMAQEDTSDSGATKSTGAIQSTDVTQSSDQPAEQNKKKSEEKIPSGSLVYESSTETVLTSRIAVLIYPGLENTSDVENVELKVYKENVEEEVFGTITIKAANYARASKHKLALSLSESDVADAKYQMAVCVTKAAVKNCSVKSEPSFTIPSGHNAKDLQCTFENGFTSSTNVPTIEEYATQKDIEALKAYSKSLAAKHTWSANMELKNLKKDNKVSSYIYLVPKLDITGLKNFLMNPDDYCARKYTLVLVAHLLNKSNEVVKADRLVAYLPQREAIYKKYLGLRLNNCTCAQETQLWVYDSELTTEKIPIEFEMNVGEPGEIKASEASEYKIWVTACAVEKDNIASKGAVQCTVPYEQQWVPTVFPTA